MEIQMYGLLHIGGGAVSQSKDAYDMEVVKCVKMCCAQAFFRK